MTQNSVNQTLNQMLILHHRSLASYLDDARPWTSYALRSEAQEILTSVVIDQRRTVDDLVDLLTERNYVINYGEFPLSYTGLNDLSFSYLLRKMIEQQQRLIPQLELQTAKLAGDDVAHALGQRTVGAAKAHLELLQRAAQLQSSSAA